jgi:hypothetical protein
LETYAFPATTPVLIVGGGPVGLSLSILLSQYGVDMRLVGTAGTGSTLDLIGPDFTLITHSDDPAWQQQATTAAAAIPVTVHALNTGPQHETGPHSWNTLCGIPPTGAVLVRPDGHIAWTAPRPPEDAELLTAVRRILATQ